jgi:opacity protein-like surface antigen
MAWQRRVVQGIAVLSVMLVSSVGARAAEAEEADYARTGLYAGVGFIYAPAVFDTGGAEAALTGPTRRLGTTISTDNSFGLDARVGYRFHPRLAAEADYQFVPGFSLDRRGVGTLADVTTHTFTLNGKVFALTDTIQPYFVGGVGFLHSNTDAAVAGFAGDGTGFAGRAGVGADYYVRPDLVVNIEFSAVLPTAPVEDVRFLPLVFGAQYRF